jgi:hypothetical protein
MTVLHAVWTRAALHLWGEEDTAQLCSVVGTGRDAGPARAHPTAVAEDVLRGVVGDVFDSLLVSGAGGSALVLQLPCHNGAPITSEQPRHTGDDSTQDDRTGPPREPTPPRSPAQGETSGAQEVSIPVGQSVRDDATTPTPGGSLAPFRVPTLKFAPADAVDLLTAEPRWGRDDVLSGASLRYWSRAAGLVLELLARQRFVPAVHHIGGDRYRGYWRVVVDDEETSRRLGALISSMPPVCRCAADAAEPVQASVLVENFLWVTVDALVRRCLEGDGLAHAIHDQPDGSCSPQMWWLRSLVRRESELKAPAVVRPVIHETVRSWLSKLESAAADRPCRTCFRLRAPRSPTTTPPQAPGEAEEPWRLTLHVQATRDPSLVIDAARLMSQGTDDPLILERPFETAREHLRADVARAARHFPPLAPCAEAAGPFACDLTLDEAYAFLRDAAPLLESEGFGVWVPQWWQKEGPRLSVRLDIRPAQSTSSAAPSELGLDAVVAFDWRLAVGDADLSPEEISHLSTLKEPLVRLRGRWLEVQPSDVQAALRFVHKGRGGRMTLAEALRQCYLADDLNTGLPMVGLRAQGWIEAFLNAEEGLQKIEHLDAPAGFHGTLRPYQLRGVEWLNFLSRLGLGACLADDMGLGKTIQLIAQLLSERERGTVPGPTLLVVPMSLVGNWRREIERFGPSLRVIIHHGTERLTGNEFVREVGRYDVVISTYGLIHRDREHLAAVDWHRITLDEAQNIKNPAAKQAVAIRSLRALHRVALTGTPVENRLSELWSILDFLNAGYLGTASEFRRRFAVPIERGRDTDRAKRLRQLIRPFVLRRLKTDPKVQVDLPEKMEMKVFCNLTREQAALYEAVVTDMLGQIGQSDGMQRRGLILATLVKLKQICNHPAHFLSDTAGLAHRSGKCDRLTEMLEEVLAEGDRALVFTQFRVMGQLLHRHMEDSLGCRVLFLHGGTTRGQRDAIVEQFQGSHADFPLLVLSLKAGGYGLNLTAASHVFHFDRWWNPAVEDQATDRAYRIGQTKRVQVHKFVCIGTLEERIDGLLEQKRNLADNIVGAGEDWLTELSTDRLREVLTLSREAVADD